MTNKPSSFPERVWIVHPELLDGLNNRPVVWYRAPSEAEFKLGYPGTPYLSLAEAEHLASERESRAILDFAQSILHLNESDRNRLIDAAKDWRSP